MGGLRNRRFVVALMAVYAALLAVLVTGPWGWELNRLTVRLYVIFRYDWPIAPDWMLPEHYGIALNVLLFVPVGLLLAAATRWALLWVTLAALVGSGLIELAQWRWLERDGSWGDVAANTVGALLGAVVVSRSTRVRRRPAAR